MSPRAAALHAGTTIDVIRAVLDEHPAPPPPLTPAQERARGQAAGKLRARLSPDELNDLYTNQRMSLEEIGRRNEASKTTVTGLAREYGIHRRTPAENRPPLPVDRDWLYEQYMTQNRPLASIATGLGMSVTNLTRRRKALGIPSRRQQAPFPVDRDWLREQYWTRNRPLADIAAELGTSIRTVNRWVKAFGIPFRGRHDRRHRCLLPTDWQRHRIGKSSREDPPEQWKTCWETASQPRSNGKVPWEPTLLPRLHPARVGLLPRRSPERRIRPAARTPRLLAGSGITERRPLDDPSLLKRGRDFERPARDWTRDRAGAAVAGGCPCQARTRLRPAALASYRAASAAAIRACSPGSASVRDATPTETVTRTWTR